jgi:hypothetical protein
MAPDALSASNVHAAGSRVWTLDPKDSWVAAEVVKIAGGTLTVKVEHSGELRTVKAEDAPLQNEDTRGVEVRRLAGPVGRPVAAPRPIFGAPIAARRAMH